MNKRHEKIKILLDKIGKFKNGVDIGCDDGIDLEILNKYGKCIGTDIVSKNHFIHDDITNSKLNDNSYDFVYTNLVLPHIIKIDSAIKEISRITRSGGHILIIVFADCLGHRIFRTKFKKSITPYHQSRGPPYPIFRLYTKKDLKIIFESNGFKTIEIGNFEYNLKHHIGKRYYYIGEKK